MNAVRMLFSRSQSSKRLAQNEEQRPQKRRRTPTDIWPKCSDHREKHLHQKHSAHETTDDEGFQLEDESQFEDNHSDNCSISDSLDGSKDSDCGVYHTPKEGSPATIKEDESPTPPTPRHIRSSTSPDLCSRLPIKLEPTKSTPIYVNTPAVDDIPEEYFNLNSSDSEYMYHQWDDEDFLEVDSLLQNPFCSTDTTTEPPQSRAESESAPLDEILTTPVSSHQPTIEEKEVNESGLTSADIPDFIDIYVNDLGVKQLHSKQKEAIESGLIHHTQKEKSRDVFLALPTGFGKSLVFQVTALVDNDLSGKVTIVVQPLISIIEDQIKKIQPVSMLIPRVGWYYHSADDDMKQRVRSCLMASPDKASEFALIYATPEFLASYLSGEIRINANRVARLVVDESHSLLDSHRASKTKDLKLFRQQVPTVPITAMTGTFTAEVFKFVSEMFDLQSPHFIYQETSRPHISFNILAGDSKRYEEIANLITRRYMGMCGVIYARTRRNCDQLRDAIREKIKQNCDPSMDSVKKKWMVESMVESYYGDVDEKKPARTLKDWSDGKIKILVATVKLGMGVDKPDVRFLIHSDLPNSLYRYTQETGRAGRDGLPADCVMFFSHKDMHFTFKRPQNFHSTGTEGLVNGEEEEKRQLEMLRFALKTECRRVGLARFLDSVHQALKPATCTDLSKMDPKTRKCDICFAKRALKTSMVDITSLVEKISTLIKNHPSRNQAAEIFKISKGANKAQNVMLRQDLINKILDFYDTRASEQSAPSPPTTEQTPPTPKRPRRPLFNNLRLSEARVLYILAELQSRGIIAMYMYMTGNQNSTTCMFVELIEEPTGTYLVDFGSYLGDRVLEEWPEADTAIKHKNLILYEFAEESLLSPRVTRSVVSKRLLSKAPQDGKPNTKESPAKDSSKKAPSKSKQPTKTLPNKSAVLTSDAKQESPEERRTRLWRENLLLKNPMLTKGQVQQAEETRNKRNQKRKESRSKAKS